MKGTKLEANRISRRQLLKILGASAGALALARCAPTTQPTAAPGVATAVAPTTQPTAAPGVATAVTQKEITLTFWRTALPTGPKDLVKAWDTFYGQTLKEMLPKGVSVTTVEVPGEGYLTKLQSAVVAGNPPDVTVIDQTWVAPLLATNALQPMPEDLIDIKASYDAVVNDLYRYGPDKKVYALPWGWWERGVFYNVKLLKEYGYSPTDLPSKTSDMIRFCQELTQWEAGQTEPKLAAMPLGGGTTVDFWTAVLDNLGGWWWLDDTTSGFDQPEWEEAWGLTLDMFDKFKLDARVGTNAIDRFYAGNAFFLPQQLWVGRVLRADHPDIEWGVRTIATPSGGPPYGLKEAHFGWGVTSLGKDEQLDAAWQLFKALNSPEWSTITAQQNNYIPARLEAQGKPPFTADNPQWAGVIEKHKPGNSTNMGFFTAELAKAYDEAWTNVYTNNANLRESLQQAKKYADAVLARSPELHETILTKKDYETHPNWSDGKLPIKPWWDGKPRSYLYPDQR